MKKKKRSRFKKLSREEVPLIEEIERETYTFSKYLDIEPEQKTTIWQDRWEKLVHFLKRIHQKGKQKITIMLIPHSESNILNLHVNFYTLLISFLGLVLIGITSTFVIIQRSSQNIQYYNMGVTNSQFYLQSSRLAEEIIPMHNTIMQFAETIAKLHQKLRIHSSYGEGGFAYTTTLDQIENLKHYIQECKKKKENCDQNLIEKILSISLHISQLDNEILEDTNHQIQEIHKELNSQEKKNFFSFIPTGLPLKGFVRNNYATKVILERGNNYPLRGVEIFTLPRTPVQATANGKVVEINYHPVFGIYIWIEHLSGIKTFYAHLNEVNVSVNQMVKKGDIIGFSGKTGKTDHNMLYYEIHIGTMAFNPHILMNDLQTLWLNLQKL